MLLPPPSVDPPSSIATSSCQCFVRRGEEESSHCVSPSLFNDPPSPQLPYSMVYVGEREREGRRNTVEHARGLFCAGYSDSGEGNANRIYLRNTRLGEGKRRNIPTAEVQKPRRRNRSEKSVFNPLPSSFFFFSQFWLCVRRKQRGKERRREKRAIRIRNPVSQTLTLSDQ